MPDEHRCSCALLELDLTAIRIFRSLTLVCLVYVAGDALWLPGFCLRVVVATMVPVLLNGYIYSSIALQIV